MLTLINAKNNRGQTVALPLADTENGITVRSVEGLGPVKASIVTSTFAQLDGSQYQASSVDNRNIVMTIGLEPYHGGATVRELRNQLYSAFMPKSTVNLEFFEDGVHFCSIMGYVESCEPNIFSQDPEVIVSIICTNPYFASPTPVIVDGATTAGQDTIPIAYSGTVETGFSFQLLVNRDISSFVISNRRPDGETKTFEFEMPLVAGDVINLNTVAKQKSISLVRGTTTSAVLYGVSPFSTWLNLWPGENNIRVLASGDPIPYKLGYIPLYGGL